MTTPKITPTQAMQLVRLIPIGREVGVDNEGNIVYASTELSTAMQVLGMHWQGNWDSRTSTWKTVPVVAMLRDWADALEKLNENNH